MGETVPGLRSRAHILLAPRPGNFLPNFSASQLFHLRSHTVRRRNIPENSELCGTYIRHDRNYGILFFEDAFFFFHSEIRVPLDGSHRFPDPVDSWCLLSSDHFVPAFLRPKKYLIILLSNLGPDGLNMYFKDILTT